MTKEEIKCVFDKGYKRYTDLVDYDKFLDGFSDNEISILVALSSYPCFACFDDEVLDGIHTAKYNSKSKLYADTAKQLVSDNYQLFLDFAMNG